MSRFRQSFSGSFDSNGGPSELERLMREKWPTLADVLFGAPAANEGEHSLPSCSIIVFVEGDRLKFCLTPQGLDKVAFGTISEPLEGFSGLERALDAGDFAWRSKRGKR